MISLHELPDWSAVADLKALYLESLLAPMDDMWETGIVNPAPHGEIRLEGTRAGYFVATEDGTLLQFFAAPGFETDARAMFEAVLSERSPAKAEVGTIDPLFLSLCLDAQTGSRVHTILYELPDDATPVEPENDGLVFRPVEVAELERAVVFQQECLATEQDLSGWLRGYSGNLIERAELLALRRGDEWLGLGECRLSDSQRGVAHVGMMVSPGHRGSGWATDILKRVSARAVSGGRRVVCSTTVDNVAAQKAIDRAGFVGRHRILTVTF